MWSRADASAADDADEEIDSRAVHEDEIACAQCSIESWTFGNELLLCDGDGCKNAFHMRCLDPPLSSVPDGTWYCPMCADQRVDCDASGHNVSDDHMYEDDDDEDMEVVILEAQEVRA